MQTGISDFLYEFISNSSIVIFLINSKKRCLMFFSMFNLILKVLPYKPTVLFMLKNIINDLIRAILPNTNFIYILNTHVGLCIMYSVLH